MSRSGRGVAAIASCFQLARNVASRICRPGLCPFCLSDRITWQRATGQGRVTSWTIVHKAWFPAFRDDIPYNVVQIELDEGPRLTSSLVDLSGRKPEIGQRVEVVFDDVDDTLTLHRFRVLA